MKRGSENHLHRTWLSHLPFLMEYAINANQPHWNNWHCEARSHQADSRAERCDFTVLGALSLGKNKDREAVANQFASIPECLSRAGFALRQGKRIEKSCRQVVFEALEEACLARILLGKKMRLEKFLRHRRRDLPPPFSWQCCKNDRRVHVALMIGG